MKKLIIALCATVIACAFSVCASAAPSRLCDDAGLLEDYEYENILEKLNEVSEKQGMDIVIYTVDEFDYNYADVEQAATETYEASGYNVDGVMLYISMAQRDWYLLTSGYGITAFTDAGLDYIAEDFLYYLSDGYYELAFESFISNADDFISAARAGTPYDYDSMPKEPFSPVSSLVISLVIGFIIALIVTGMWKGQLKSVAFNTRAQNYMKPGSLNVTGSRELFLYRSLNRTERPRDTGSGGGGGSTTHSSSSGRSYGGRGGKF